MSHRQAKENLIPAAFDNGHQQKQSATLNLPFLFPTELHFQPEQAQAEHRKPAAFNVRAKLALTGAMASAASKAESVSNTRPPQYMAQSPQHPQLVLGPNRSSVAAPQKILSSPYGIRLPHHSARLTNNAYVKAFCTASQTSLTTLDVHFRSEQGISAQAVSDIVQVTCPLLQTLNMCSNKLNAEAMSFLVKGNWPRLTSLDLSHNSLDTDAIQVLGEASPWPLLQKLNLSNNKLGSGAIAHLISTNWPNLHYLDLRFNQMDILAVSELVKGKWPEITHLFLGRHIAQDAIHILVKEPTANKIEWPNLQELDLSCNHLNAAAIGKLLRGNWPWLHTLSLWGNALGASATSKLSKGNWPQLKYLDLSANLLDADAMKGLLKYQKWCKLEVLKLSLNKLDVEGFELLAKAEWDSLREVNLSFNQLPWLVSDALKTARWPTLQVLDLSQNNFSQADLMLFADGNKMMYADINKLEPPGYWQFPQLHILNLSTKKKHAT